jgi:hypothetical protein
VHGNADKRSIPGGPKRRTSNPRGIAVGIDRPTPSNCRARSAAELVARAFASGIGCCGSCCRVGGPSGRLIIVQPETVLRWRRNGWSALWRYRTRGRWGGGRPGVSGEVHHLIVRLARENFLWGAPRIHGEPLMLGFSVSEATVSRYLHSRGRRPGQSWQTFLRNQAMVFGHREYAEQRSRGDAGLHIESCWTHFKRSGAAQIATATLSVGLRRGVAQPSRP